MPRNALRGCTYTFNQVYDKWDLMHDRLYDLIPVRIQMHCILNNRPDQANAKQSSYDIGKPYEAWLTSEEDRSLIG